MKQQILSLAAVTLLAGTFGTVSAAEEGLNLFGSVKVGAEIRPRYEYANVKENGLNSADAYTARTMLDIHSEKTLGMDILGVFLEVNSVNNFGYENYNSTANGETDYDVIADPNQARVTQAYVDVRLLPKTLLRVGRQDVNLDNQRFVGTVDWRQMKQTYDAAAMVSSPLDGLTLVGAYVFGISGIKVQPNNRATDTGSVILNGSYAAADWLKVTAYGYLLASIHDTYGVALTGTIPAGGIKVNYRAEYAVQSDPSLEYRVEDVKADADYYNLDLGANVGGMLAGVNYEVQSGTNGTDDKTAFTTPLGTNHKFNGWADKFLTTPSNGLVDANVRLGYVSKAFGKVLAFYHKFDSEVGSTDYGSEIDALYTVNVPGVTNLDFLAKVAFYSKGDSGNDTTKGWLQLDYKFATD